MLVVLTVRFEVIVNDCEVTAAVVEFTVVLVPEITVVCKLFDPIVVLP